MYGGEGLEQVCAVGPFSRNSTGQRPIGQALFQAPSRERIRRYPVIRPGKDERRGRASHVTGRNRRWGMLDQRQRIEPVQKAAPGQQIHAGPAQTARRTTTQDETPTFLVGVVQALYRIEERRYGLDLVHENRPASAGRRHGATGFNECLGVCQQPRPLQKIRQIDYPGILREQRSQQRRFAGLTRQRSGARRAA